MDISKYFYSTLHENIMNYKGKIRKTYFLAILEENKPFIFKVKKTNLS